MQTLGPRLNYVKSGMCVAYEKSSSQNFPLGNEQFLLEHVPCAKNGGKYPLGSSAHVVFWKSLIMWTYNVASYRRLFQ